MKTLKKVHLSEALVYSNGTPWPKVAWFDPISRMFHIDYGASVALRPDLSELGLEVLFSKEELEAQGRAGVLAQISKRSAELTALIATWINAPE